MPRVYANAAHTYTHYTERGGAEYRWPANGWRDVPDEVADVVCTAHPDKLVRLKAGENKPGERTPEPVAEPVVETPAEPAAETAAETPAETTPEKKGKPLVAFKYLGKKQAP